MWCCADVPELSLAQQALVAAHALQAASQAAADELAPWDAAPYVDAVLAQRSSAPVLRALCSLLRCVCWCSADEAGCPLHSRSGR